MDLTFGASTFFDSVTSVTTFLAIGVTLFTRFALVVGDFLTVVDTSLTVAADLAVLRVADVLRLVAINVK
tara:strand:- start:360 stop:569 length:210 start_codon:yes stop_codon:yes gene_type:complete